MNYLRARLAEKGTYAGILALAVAIAAMLWYWRVGYKTGALAAIGATVAAIPSNLRWLWPMLARFTILRAQKSTEVSVPAPIVAKPVNETLIFAKDDPNMTWFDDIKVDAEKKVGTLMLGSLGAKLVTALPEAQEVYTDFMAARSSDSTVDWVKFISDTAELVHGLAQDVAAVQAENATLKAAQPAAVISVGNDAPAGVISPINSDPVPGAVITSGN